jgi:hypothetical protein
VRVANPPPLDQPTIAMRRRQLAFLRLHAQDAGVGLLERVEILRRADVIGRALTDSIRTASVRARARQRRARGSRRPARSPRSAMSATAPGLNGQTGADGVARAGIRSG